MSARSETVRARNPQIDEIEETTYVTNEYDAALQRGFS